MCQCEDRPCCGCGIEERADAESDPRDHLGANEGADDAGVFDE